MTVDKHNIDWTPVEKALNEGTFSGYKIAILETEKILRGVLDEQSIPGRVIGHRIDIVRTHLSRPDDLEHARLIAGKIVREPGFDVSREDAKMVISSYYHAITDIVTLQRHHFSLSQRLGLILQRFLPLQQARSILLWIAVASFGILFLSETTIGHSATERIANLFSFLALFIILPIVALILLVKIGRTFLRERKRDIPPH